MQQNLQPLLKNLQDFEFNGSAEPVIRTAAGSGSLFSIGGGEEIATVAEESTGLFTVSGKAQAPFARTKIGSGTTFVSGDSKNRSTRIYAGEGQLSTFGGGAEVVGFNPAEETVLYEFGGTAEPVIRTRGFNASGSASVSGEAVPVITLNFIGSGNLTTFGGGAESRTIDAENTTLSKHAVVQQNIVDGDTTISGEATDIKITSAIMSSVMLDALVVRQLRSRPMIMLDLVHSSLLAAEHLQELEIMMKLKSDNREKLSLLTSLELVAITQAALHELLNLEQLEFLCRERQFLYSNSSVQLESMVR